MEISPSLIWFFVGVAFLAAEMLLPGFILIFFTAGSWICAVTVWLTDIGLPQQLALFIVSSLILLFALRKYGLKTFKGTVLENVDRSFEESKIGKKAIVTKAIAPNIPGEIKVSGSFWRAAAGEDIEEGRSVVIEGREADDTLTFKVRPA